MVKAGVVLGLGGILLGAAALWLALEAGDRARQAEQVAMGAENSLRVARSRIEDASREAEAATGALRSSEERVAGLDSRLRALEAAPGGIGGNGTPGGPSPAAETSGGPATTPPSDAATAALRAEFADLRKRFFGGEATADEQKRFWELARTEGFLDGVLAEMEASVAASPEDIAGRMDLSQAYLARLFTVPAGPEMGVWAAKAEVQWKEVLARDDRHWMARYSLATSWARYPDFLNKGPDAIREFETLRRQQEAGPVEDRQAGVYLELGNLYKRAGNGTRQREVLEEGLRRHPGSEEISRTLEALTAR